MREEAVQLQIQNEDTVVYVGKELAIVKCVQILARKRSFYQK